MHIKRKVNNAMVSGMWGWVLSYLSENALRHLEATEALAVIKALHAELIENAPTQLSCAA